MKQSLTKIRELELEIDRKDSALRSSESQLEVFKSKYEEVEAKSSDDRRSASQQLEELRDKVKKLQ